MKPLIKTDLSALNDTQIEAVVSEDKRLLVLAGAGSGKTRTLLQRIIYLVEEKGVSPSGILAITFTKNATNEMIDRLIISADETNKYEKILSDKTLDRDEKDRERRAYQKKFKWIDGRIWRVPGYLAGRSYFPGDQASEPRPVAGGGTSVVLCCTDPGQGQIVSDNRKGQ